MTASVKGILVLTRVTALTCLLLAIGPLAACAEQQQTETRTYEVTDTVAALAVSSLGGRITITAGSGTTTHVTEKLWYTGAKPVPEHRVVGTDLMLTSGCRGHRGSCGVGYHLVVPAAVAATLDSAGGVVSVSGMSGELNITSGGGAVEVDGSTQAAVTARTGGGAVRLTFTSPPRSVSVDSGGGEVTVRLPQDRYSVDADSAGGETTVDVPTDRVATHRVSVRSDGGAIVVTTTE